jgi:hypothetical protein
VGGKLRDQSDQLTSLHHRQDAEAAGDHAVGGVAQRLVRPATTAARRANSCENGTTPSRSSSSHTIGCSRWRRAIFSVRIERGSSRIIITHQQVSEPDTSGWSAPDDLAQAGFGLAIGRRVAREHGGDLTCDAGPGGRFVLRLPASASVAASDALRSGDGEVTSRTPA